MAAMLQQMQQLQMTQGGASGAQSSSGKPVGQGITESTEWHEEGSADPFAEWDDWEPPKDDADERARWIEAQSKTWEAPKDLPEPEAGEQVETRLIMEGPNGQKILENRKLKGRGVVVLPPGQVAGAEDAAPEPDASALALFMQQQSGTAPATDYAVTAEHMAALGVSFAMPEPALPVEQPAITPEQQAYLSLCALANIAEEACAFASRAATFVASAGPADIDKTSQMSAAAQQAADSARNASDTIKAYIKQNPPDESTGGFVLQLQTKVQKDAENGSQAAQSANSLATAIIKTQRPVVHTVPCKYFLGGECRKGAACSFMHDLSALQPRPLTKKRAEICKFFMEGECLCGTSCSRCHGTEELDKVTEIVNRIKKRKMFRLHEAPEAWIDDDADEAQPMSHQQLKRAGDHRDWREEKGPDPYFRR